MATNHREELQKIRTFPSLIRYLRDEMGWPIESDDFEELTFEYTPEELGIDEKNSAKIESIKRLRPLVPHQPWGIFFVKFEPKQLPVVALRRILSKVVVKKRASSYQAEQVAWSADDLLFVSNYGESDKRSISFAHFSQSGVSNELPRLKVLGWDNRDTPLHLDDIAEKLKINLSWPSNEDDVDSWRSTWRSAFTVEHREIITTAKRLSIRLAELAQSIRDRIKSALEIESEDGPLTKIMSDFKKALIHDLDKDSFADMYAQTIAYGLLSVRIADPKSTTAEDLTKHIHTSSFLNELMTSFLKAGGLKGEGGRSSIDFDELGVSEVVELLDDANMEAVLRDFGDRNPQDDPVIHFYESFLSHYDAKSRMKRGVFYTPKPVVSFIVRSVDELLQTEFGLEDGLADITTWGEMVKLNTDLEIPDGISDDQPFVQILDPATGTGTFLVKVIDLVYKNMVAKWSAQDHGTQRIKELWNEYVPKNLLPRLHGFELLMAPYAIAHLKIGLKLYETGYRFENNERVRVYLTNALEPAEDRQLQFDFIPALAHEFLAVHTIKSKGCFTAVIGNPPYSGISINKSEWITELIEDYKYINGEHFREKKHWLQDDYVKFIRYGHSLIENKIGVLAFINNHSFLDNPTFRGMRWQLLKTFEKMVFIDLHGNYRRKEVCPNGSPDENVFDIQQGVSINIFIKTNKKIDDQLAIVNYFSIYGGRTYKSDFLHNSFLKDMEFHLIKYNKPYFFFIPKEEKSREDYEKGFMISNLFHVFVSGIVTARDNFAIDFEKDVLHQRINHFTDPAISDKDIRQTYFSGRRKGKYLPGDSRGWNMVKARKIIADFDHESIIIKFSYRPFDERFIYYSPNMVDWGREKVMQHFLIGENVGLVLSKQVKSFKHYQHCFITKLPFESSIVSNRTSEIGYGFHLYLYNDCKSILNIIGIPDRKPNLKMEVVREIANNIDLIFVIEKEVGESTFAPIDILDYIYSILQCPTYREKYKEFLKVDFPRIPYPKKKDDFWKLVRLGCELRQIHLQESPIIEKFITRYPIEGSNRVETVKYEGSMVRINKEQCFDGVPEVAWEFYIGGYQPAQKWLKDRKGRVLKEEDINHYQKIIKALVETDRIMKEIDEVVGDSI